MCDWEDRVKKVAQEIERYLEEHPNASDSLEGIATWWVSRQRIRNELDVVQAALEQLFHSGIVTTGRDKGEQGPVYRLNNKNH